MSVHPPVLVVYVDVDETLIRNYGRSRIPMPAAIRHVRALFQQGAHLYCWSSGGAEYARASAEECELADCFRAFLPKPQVLIDTAPMSLWPFLLCVHPNACEGQTVSDYQTELISLS
ncbi:hypothetical protein MF271_07785 [Deinococcus sp. KNUC1210]|uniref:hypothetical protein n=1 Tax=Deinococcus sp. KNUC1210 TaxID=2917691 RepID=UPI001EEFA2A2|nr:hypothetical protein [Deinococcus sp. KNUC1210]ULH16470.1 hypothetical protein MF271_07785 [Deinococcus sp. KNUC1210]